MNTPQALFHRINNDPKRVRIFCILGHIDSGKTSVSDYLIGILSNSLCGTMKYMDTRLDEQEKQITMKTSCFTFFYQDYAYHLLDTPGHLDFFHEIKQGILLSEGIILLISTVKGIESQTLQIIKSIRSYLNRKRVILILNKIDRLIVEKELDQLELYLYLKETIHQINQLLDSPNYFDPKKDNVVFASALDGWGFRLSDLVRIYSERYPFLASPPPGSGGLKISRDCFWGTYIIKKRKIIETEELDERIIFCSLVLNDLTTLYNLFLIDPDPRLSEKEIKKMKKRVLKRIGITGKQAKRIASQKRTNRRNALKKVFERIYPIKEILLNSIVRVFPPVLTYLDQGLPYVLANHKKFKPEVITEFKSGSKSKITLLYCIKFLLVPRKIGTSFSHLEKNKEEEGEEEAEEEEEKKVKKKVEDSVFERFQFVGLCKIFSGVLRRGDTCQVVTDGPPMEVKIGELFLLQGNEIHPISEVHSGNIFGIGASLDSLESFKRGFIVQSKLPDLYTNSPFPRVRSFFRARISNPILSYSVEAKSHDDFYLLLRSLKMLNKIDSAVQIFVRPTGENIIRTEGEVHMDRCLYDLRHHFFRNEVGRFVVSEDPMVQFRETIVKPQIVTLENIRHLDDEVEDLLRMDDLELRKKAKYYDDVFEEEEEKKDIRKKEKVEDNEEDNEEQKNGEKNQQQQQQQLKEEEQQKEILSPIIESNTQSSTLISPTTDFFLKKKQDGERMELEKKSGLEVRYSKCFKRVYTIENSFHKVKMKLKIYPPVNIEEIDDIVITSDQSTPKKKKKKLKLKNLKEWKEYLGSNRKDLFLKYLIEKKIREREAERIKKNDGSSSSSTSITTERTSIMKDWENQVWHIDLKNKNVLLNHVEWYLDSKKFVNYFEKNEKKVKDDVETKEEEKEKEVKEEEEGEEEEEDDDDERIDILKRNDDKVIAGFLVSVSKGSICGEAITNCIFSIEDIEFEKKDEEITTLTEDEEEQKQIKKTVFSFSEIEIINLVKDGILKCFDGCKRKLLEPIYKCFISVHSKQLKHCMKVIKKRRGKVMDSFQNIKNNQWNIEALIPVVESIGMINEMRDETSGLATIFMKFFKYSLIENEEIEDELISSIQKKKGIYVQRLVIDSDKQRTISKKK